MRKHERVPTALHSELTEYASLLRALRASHTLDLSQNILEPEPYTVLNADNEPDEVEDARVDDDDENIVDEVENTLGAAPVSATSESTPSSSRPGSPPLAGGSGNKRKRARLSVGSRPKKQKSQRDLWTRWPLLIKDVPIPEWTLGDEVAQMTETILREQRSEEARSEPCTPSSSNSCSPSAAPSSPAAEEAPAASDGSIQDSAEDEDDEPALDEELDRYVPHLTWATSNYVSTILAHLVSSTPKRPPSQQNRITPIDWRFLLDVLRSSSNSELADPEIIENVRKRLEELYGSQAPNESERGKRRDGAFQFRMERRLAGKETRKARLANSLKATLTLASPPTPEQMETFA